MKEKLLVVSPSCPTCEAVQKHLSEKGVLDNYKIVDVSTVEGAEFAKKLGITGVPECVVVEGEGEKRTVRVCTSEEWRGMLKGE